MTDAQKIIDIINQLKAETDVSYEADKHRMESVGDWYNGAYDILEDLLERIATL